MQAMGLHEKVNVKYEKIGGLKNRCWSLIDSLILSSWRVRRATGLSAGIGTG